MNTAVRNTCYPGELEGCSRNIIFFFLVPNTMLQNQSIAMPPNNDPVQIKCSILFNVLAIEAKLDDLFANCQYDAALRTFLK